MCYHWRGWLLRVSKRLRLLHEMASATTRKAFDCRGWQYALRTAIPVRHLHENVLHEKACLAAREHPGVPAPSVVFGQPRHRDSQDSEDQQIFQSATCGDLVCRHQHETVTRNCYTTGSAQPVLRDHPYFNFDNRFSIRIDCACWVAVFSYDLCHDIQTQKNAELGC